MRKILYGVGIGLLGLNAYASNTQLIIKYKSDYKAIASHSAALQPLSLSNTTRIQQISGAKIDSVSMLVGGAYVISFDRELSLSEIASLENSGEFEAVKQSRMIKLWPSISSGDDITNVQATDINLQVVDAVLNAGGYTFNNAYQYDMLKISPLGRIGDNFESAFTNYFTSTKPGNGIIVAVIDTGYVPHPNLESGLSGYISASANPVSGYTFISDCRNSGVPNCTGAPVPNGLDYGDWRGKKPPKSSWHGTHVTGTIIGQGSGNIYPNVITGDGSMLGGAYGAKVLPLRVIGSYGASNADINRAITYAVGTGSPVNSTPAKVINMSLGDSENACDSTTQSVIDAAINSGAIIVVAAGNGYGSGSGTDNVLNTSPAGCNGVIRAAATGSGIAYGTTASLATYSYYGPTTITASGSEIYSTFYSSESSFNPSLFPYNYHLDSGTSMAAPHTAAAIADLLSLESSLKLADIQQILMNSARPLTNYSNTGGSVYTGGLDLYAAIRYMNNVKYLTLANNSNNEYVYTDRASAVQFTNNSGSTIKITAIVDRGGVSIANKVTVSSQTIANGQTMTANLESVQYSTAVKFKNSNGEVVGSVIYLGEDAPIPVPSKSPSGGCSMLVGSTDYTLIMLLVLSCSLWLSRKKLDLIRINRKSN